MNQVVTQEDRRLVQIEDKINKQVSSAILVGLGGITFQNAGEVMEYAKMMAVSGSAVPKHLRGQPGACLGIIDDAIRFRTSPYALARKSYFVNDNLAYEAQVLAGIVNAFAPLKQRPAVVYEGEGNDRVCTVTGHFLDGAVRDYRSPAFGKITPKNSPLWKNDPDQQQAYFSLRGFARRHCPEILLGIYDVEEMAALRARDITPDSQSLGERLAAAKAAPQEASQEREGFDTDFVTSQTAGMSGEAENDPEPASAPTPGDDAGGSGTADPPGSAADPSTVGVANGEDASEAAAEPQAAPSPSTISDDERAWLVHVFKTLKAAVGPDVEVLVAMSAMFKDELPAKSELAQGKARTILSELKRCCGEKPETAVLPVSKYVAGLIGVDQKELMA